MMATTNNKPCPHCNGTGEDEISESYLVFVPCKRCRQGPIAQRQEWQRQRVYHLKQARHLRRLIENSEEKAS